MFTLPANAPASAVPKSPSSSKGFENSVTIWVCPTFSPPGAMMAAVVAVLRVGGTGNIVNNEGCQHEGAYLLMGSYKDGEKEDLRNRGFFVDSSL
jgi:hypothetical protein